MKARKFSLIASIAFLSIHIILVSGLQVSFAYIPAENPKIDQAVELLRADQILTLAERNKLSELVNSFTPAGESLSDLQGLSSKTVQKVESDKNGLKYLLLNLDKLANSEYARTIKKVEESDLKACWKTLDKLEENLAAIRPQLPSSQKHLDAEHYLKIIKGNSIFLVGGGDSVAIPDLWESIQRAVRPAYLSWNKEYTGLLRELKKHQKSFYSPSNFLTYEEGRFMQMFSLVQVSLRKLSESNSRDF